MAAVSMAYQYRDDPDSGTPDPYPLVTLVLGVAVRLVGVIVLGVGLWAGVKVIAEAWSLYEQPQRIERLAEAVQQGSNLDGVFAGLGGAGEASPPGSGEAGLRLSYFAAWFIALLLMFVIGSLAMAAITTGGRLALYDLAARQQVRAVMREVRRLRRAA
jgi:hypothetical protein